MSQILGVKATHDGGFALIDRNNLLVSVEIEKVANNRRHARPKSWNQIALLLQDEGFDPRGIDKIALDGWWPEDLQYWLRPPSATSEAPSRAPYTEDDPDLTQVPDYPGTIEFAGRMVPTCAYPHSVGHVFGAYCPSPYAGSRALVLVWDGGMPATLYVVGPAMVRRLDRVLPITGFLYPVFASILEPYRQAWQAGPVAYLDDTSVCFGDQRWADFVQAVPGKAMAYAGLGHVVEDVIAVLDHSSIACGIGGMQTISDVAADVQRVRGLEPAIRATGATDPSIMASFQEWEYRQLEASLRQWADPKTPLIFTGGCALNIKWNSRLRASGMFSDVWVPPFPNDSGSAIGVGCAAMYRNGYQELNWNVFQGPALRKCEADAWPSTQCSLSDLAALLHQGYPVVVLHGRAELGPRALGRRSILAAATDERMRDRLNQIKGRESYRPVAPICLETHAPDIFDPGTPDPYMLFDHRVRHGWADRIPAVVHADGTARLQTVLDYSGVTAELLGMYYRISGIPVLCNTSANLPGCGFFPDVRSAMDWGKVPHVWSDGWLWTKENPAEAGV